MPSTNMLTHSKTLCRCLAKLLLSFCGIASFGVFSMMGVLALGVLSVLSIGALSLSVLGSDAHAARVTSATTDVTVDLGASISVRVLDSTAAQEISLLAFDLTPTAAGVTSTKRAVVDVSTSNITGYKLYVEANGKDHNNNYTTDLVHSDTEDSHVIPTSVSSSSSNNFWNYVNPLISTTSVIPAHGTPDKINQETTPIDSSQTNIDINVGVDTTITAGTYSNQLLFTAIANEDSINYTLDFDSNLPTGADPSTLADFPADQSATSVTTSHTFTIPSTTPTLTGYSFINYQDSDTSTETYNPGDSVTVMADTSTSSSALSGSKTLKAIWSNITYSIDFNSNVPSGTTATGSTASMANLDYNTTYNLTTNGYAITGYSFEGWCTTAVTNPITDAALSCTSASGTYYTDGASVQGLTKTTGDTITMYALWSINQYTLTVDPNGGTWSGSTSTQSFTQDYGTTKTISNPTAGPTYTIGYDMGSTGITKPTSPTSVQRPFSSWSLSGSGTWIAASNTYTYEAGNGTLTASYDTTSNTFTLPAITKTGHTCTWHAGSASGTEYASGATNVTITANTTFYATCSANSYTVNISNSNTTSSSASLSIPYGGNNKLTVTPSSGYYLSGVSCPSGYTCTGYSTGSAQTGTQTVTVTNNSVETGGTISFTGTALTLAQTCNNAATHATFTYSGVAYVKLLDGNCWTKEYVASVIGSETFTLADFSTGTYSTKVSSYCPSGTYVGTGTNSAAATQGTYNILVGKYTGTGLYDVTGWTMTSSLNYILPLTGGSSGTVLSLNIRASDHTASVGFIQKPFYINVPLNIVCYVTPSS